MTRQMWSRHSMGWKSKRRKVMQCFLLLQILQVLRFVALCLFTLHSGADPGFLPGEGAKGLMILATKGWWDGDERFLTFANADLQLFKILYCHIMLEWCWTTIQGTPVSLLSALETKDHAPSARRVGKLTAFWSPFRPGALFSVASYPRPRLSP